MGGGIYFYQEIHQSGFLRNKLKICGPRSGDTLSGIIPLTDERSRIRQWEKLNCDTTATEGSSDLTKSSGARMLFQIASFEVRVEVL